MKKLLLLVLLPIVQLYNSQITFEDYVYSWGPDPYIAILSGNGTIYYTTDGSEPNLNSASGLNTISISISQILTVKAVLKNSSNQLSEVFSKKYYFGPFPQKNIYFKKPEEWTSACSFVNSYDPELTVDISSGPPMTPVCDGWYKATNGYFVGFIVYDNCKSIAPPPIYQYYSIVTEDVVFYDYSSGPITNPPVCLLAVDDSAKTVAVVKIFPNPVQDFVSIQSDSKYLTYEIIDVTGKSVLKNTFSSGKIDVSVLPAGNYFIKLNSLSHVNTIVKFIKK